MMSQRKDRDMTPATLTQLPLTRCGSTERNPNLGLGPTSQFQALNSHMTRGYHIGQCRMERLHYHRTCDCIGLMDSESLGKVSLVSRGCPGLNPLRIPAVRPPWPCAGRAPSCHLEEVPGKPGARARLPLGLDLYVAGQGELAEALRTHRYPVRPGFLLLLHR